MALSSAQMAVLAGVAEGEMLYAGIFAPLYGEREDLPSVSLADSFLTEGENVILRRGVAERIKMQLPEFVETTFAVGTLTATNGSAVVTASGGAGTWSSSATHKPYLVGRKIWITDDGSANEYTILSVADAGATINLTVNYAGTGGAGRGYSIGTAGTKVPTPDGNPSKRYHRLVQGSSASEMEYLFAFTKAHAYLWSTSWSAWILKFTCGSDCLQWETAEIDNQIIATNNVDKVQAWGTSTGSAFANLGGHADGIDIGAGVRLTKAKYVEVFENYVHLGNVVVGGTTFNNARYWSSKDDETDWDATGSGDAGSQIIHGCGPMRGMKAWGHTLVIAMEDKLYGYWLITDSAVWNGDVISELGCRAAHSMVIDGDGRFYWLASDYSIRTLPGGNIISQAKEKTLKGINAALEELIEAKWIEEYGHLWFSIPSDNQSTANDKVLWYDPGQALWGELNLAIASFGKYTRQTVYTWGTWPFQSWGTIAWETWNGPENVIGSPLDLGGDYSGYTYTLHGSELDNGAEYTGEIVLSTDLLERIVAKRLGVGLREYKRVLEMQIVAYAENAGTLSVSIKRDTETAFQLVGTASLVDPDREIVTVDLTSVDIRFKHAEIKISGSNRFRFIGVMLGFMRDGSR